MKMLQRDAPHMSEAYCILVNALNAHNFIRGMVETVKAPLCTTGTIRYHTKVQLVLWALFLWVPYENIQNNSGTEQQMAALKLSILAETVRVPVK